MIFFKLLTALTCVISLAYGREKKQFGLFSIVQFPNEECTTIIDTSLRGLCMTENECSNAGGAKDGACASGFGVCCFLSLKTCGATITRNVTYVSNPSYPLPFTKRVATCTYTVNPLPDGICQVRLDFRDFRLQNAFGPEPSSVPPLSVAGDCDALERFVPISPGGFNPPILCGKLTGQHIYIDAASMTPAATFTISTNAGTTNRFWNIQVSQIACNSLFRAPHDCVQYLTGSSNTFSSFGYDGFAIPITRQSYAICIRREEGFCGISYSVVQSPIGLNGFQFNKGKRAKRSTACEMARLYIPTQRDAEKENNFDYYCGAYFNEIAGNIVNGLVNTDVTPFRVYVSTTDQTQASRPDTDVSAVGFNLMYQQRPCVANTGVTL